MSPQRLNQILSRLLRYSFYGLFFLVPLIMTPINYELFEFNKMVTVYFFTIIIVAAWLMKMVLQRRIIFQRTFLDLPLLLFFVFNFLSFVLSIDRHTSLFGYYSRFNGGLLSISCYLLLYYAFVSNFTGAAKGHLGNSPTPRVKSADTLGVFPCRGGGIGGALIALISSATLVAIYGILQHFGLDKNFWVQDVQNRVFSSLGQPNWLAAYLVMLTPLAMALALPKSNSKKQKAKTQIKYKQILFFANAQNQKFLNFAMYICFLIFYICILFTKSRSGLLGFAVANFIFWLLIFLKSFKIKAKINKFFTRSCILFIKNFLIFNLSFLILTLVIGTPWTPNLSQILSTSSTSRPTTNDHLSAPLAERLATNIGGTESGEIRQIVWRGAWQVFKSNPVLGTGPETFAYSYYWFRPVEHNLTSEWDFLYNKAHNEYLNLLACTGILGLASYLSIIGMFTIWTLKKLQAPNPKFQANPKQQSATGGPNSKKFIEKLKNWALIGNWKLEIGNSPLLTALLAGYLGLLVSNFFGFSVVVTNLFFFLFPAIAFTLLDKTEHMLQSVKKLPALKIWQYATIILLLLVTCCLLLVTCYYWLADYRFAQARKLNRSELFLQAQKEFQLALQFNPREPLFQLEAADNLAQLAPNTPEPEKAQEYRQKAEDLAHKALKISPYNLNNLKIAARTFYRLSESNDQFLIKTLKILKTSAQLGPTDAKIHYNLALLYGQIGENEEAIRTLENTLRMKENYQDAWYALSLFYEEAGQKEKAILALENLLKWYPEDEKAQEKLEELK